jgi:hypothetical protein
MYVFNQIQFSHIYLLLFLKDEEKQHLNGPGKDAIFATWMK